MKAVGRIDFCGKEKAAALKTPQVENNLSPPVLSFFCFLETAEAELVILGGVLKLTGKDDKGNSVIAAGFVADF